VRVAAERAETAFRESQETLRLDARERIAERYERGRRERGRAEGEPFRWDRELIDLDEIEELVDAWIYRCERYREWYGPRADDWPYVVCQPLDAALHALEDLLAELCHEPLEMADTRERRA